MKFKSSENNLIWESHYGEYYSDEEDMGCDGEAEIVLSAEPMGEMDIEGDGGDELSDVLGDEDSDSDDDNEIVLHAIRKLVKRGEKLLELCQNQDLKPWMIAKIIKAEDYISDVFDQLDDDADFANDGFEDSYNISL